MIIYFSIKIKILNCGSVIFLNDIEMYIQTLINNKNSQFAQITLISVF